MAHQEDYRGPYGGSDVMRDDRMRRQNMQGRGSQDRYGMQSGGDWHDQGASYGPPYNQNAGQEWQQSEFGHGRGNEGQGNYGQGYYGPGMNSPRNAGGGNYRGQGSWRDDDRGSEYGWSASEGYNTQPYSSGGYYGGYYDRGRQGQGSYDQGHAGRGPRNYRRSDERIREDINEELTRHPGIDASDVDVRVEDGQVTLSGMVEDRRAKRLAEDIAEQCSGVDDVHNELHIERSGRQARRAGAQSSSQSSSQDESRSGTSTDREVPRRTDHEAGRRTSGSSASHSESESSRGKNGGTPRNAS